MENARYARHMAILEQLRSRQWVSSTSLATRFGVSSRTIYRDIQQLISYGLPIEAATGRDGGYVLNSESPFETITLDSDDALRLYVLGMANEGAPSTREADALAAASGRQRRRPPTGHPPGANVVPAGDTPTDASGANGRGDALPDAGVAETDAGLDEADVRRYSQDMLAKLSQRIYFDTRDWYWKDEGTGHVPVIRYALVTSTALGVVVRTKHSTDLAQLVLKPYGLVWKGGEWWLVAADLHNDISRYRLNHIERVDRTDLRFEHPGTSFNLRDWWTDALEDYGRGDVKVSIVVQPQAREEMLRLGLKPDSIVTHGPDGKVTINLFVDKWQWLVPLVASFGADILITEPAGLRDAVREHHELAAARYREPVKQPRDCDTLGGAGDVVDLRDRAAPSYRNDDSRLRATRGRNPRSPR